MPKIVELKQDRNLICPNFDGYKLSLEQIPVFKEEVMWPPLKAESNEEQYSLLHAELFSTQNLLVVDPWARTQSYFINCLGEVVRCAYDESKGRPAPQQVVYRSGLKMGDDHKRGDYNFSFRFLSEKFCLICDGIKTLSLFETGDRLKATEWKLVASCKVEGNGIPDDEKNYIIFDSRLDIIQERKQISAVLGHVQHVDSNVSRGGSNHFLYLHWMKWTLENSGWKLEKLDTLEGKGWVYYCALEPRSESVVISSNQDFKLRSQISQAVCNQMPPNEGTARLHGETDTEINVYSGIYWSQTDEDLLLKFDVIPDKVKSDYNIKTQATKISVNCNEKVLLDNELFDKIDMNLTMWTIENNFLQITLVKNTPNVMWSSLLANGMGPKEINDKCMESCLAREQQPIANLEAPIEECDFPLGATDDEITVSRFNIPTRAVTHTILMRSTPPLFFTSLRPGFPNALATREDVDCSLWLQQYNPSKPSEWSMRHEGNLHAFGYVQASKQEKKFMDCSPDLGFAMIADSHRHVFLYKTKYDTAGGLRNRNGPQITLGKQHLIALEDAGEILGLSTANSVATLLTEKQVFFFQIES